MKQFSNYERQLKTSNTPQPYFGLATFAALIGMVIGFWILPTMVGGFAGFVISGFFGALIEEHVRN
jgi:hypothetical protein